MTPLSTPAAQGTVAQWRKKPVVIEAVRWDGDQSTFDTIERWAGKPVNDLDGYTLLIPTLEGEMQASLNDWIIKGVKGEIYPCKPDIFAATYEPASPSPEALPASGVDVQINEKALLAAENAMKECRLDLIHSALARIWPQLAEAAVSAYLAALTSAPAPEDRT